MLVQHAMNAQNIRYITVYNSALQSAAALCVCFQYKGVKQAVLISIINYIGYFKQFLHISQIKFNIPNSAFPTSL